MRLTRYTVQKKEEQPKKKKEKTLTTNFENIKHENIIYKNILQKNLSLKNIKEKIRKESNNNIHEILSSDESRLKAIKYVINASKGKENHKNNINQNHNKTTSNINNNNILNQKKNLSLLSEIPFPNDSRNKIKVKRSQKVLYTKIDQISPIKKESRNKFINEDKPLNEEALLRDNNILTNKNGKKFVFDSPMPIFPRNESYDIVSHREISMQFIQPNNKFLFENNNNNAYLTNHTQNNFYVKNEINPILKNNNFYHKIKYVRKNHKRDISPYSDYEYNNMQSRDNMPNQTFNNFYIHKQINKSGICDNNYRTNNNSINRNRNYQEPKIIYSSKNSRLDINYNLNDEYNNHRKNASQDQYSNIYQNHSNKNSFYLKESNSNKRMDFINIPNNIKFSEINNNRKRNIIRIMDNAHAIQDITNNNLHQKSQDNVITLKKKNNSFYINDFIPININNFNSKKEYNDNDYINNLTQNIGTNTYSGDFSFQKKLVTNQNYNPILTNNSNKNININKRNNMINDHKENIRILVKKRPLKESLIYDYINNTNPKGNKLLCLSISDNISFNYEPKKGSKISFENENDIIEYINKKFEEDKKINYDKKLKYTGFILCKKLRGKILYEVRIEENINKLNKKLKEENVQIGNEFLEIITAGQKNEYDNLKDEINKLEKEINKIKEENNSISKNDYLKNELIKKLDKEKQNLIEENKKIFNELEQIKTMNKNLNEKLNQISNNNKIENIIRKYKIENALSYNVINEHKIEAFDNDKLKEEKIERNKTPISNENNNATLNLNFNNSNVEAFDSKKNNRVSIFRLSKVSDIKEIKMDNIDSSDKDLRTNLDLLNGNNNLNNNKNNEEINSFNEDGED